MISIVTNDKERQRFLKFAFVGVIGAIIDFGTFNLFTSGFKINPIVSSVVSFSAAVVSNFTWNRYWTYPDSRSKKIIRQLSEFLVINLVGLGIRTPIFAILESKLPEFISRIPIYPINHFDPRFLGHNISLAISVIVVMFWNFYVNRYLTYNDIL